MKFDYSKLTGRVVTKEDFSYEEDRKAWNRAIEKYPLVIVYCNNENDISNAIAWTKINSLEIRIRSGSHHYEGYSTGNDIVIIDVSKMNNIIVNEEKNIVTIQGGVRNREIYETLGAFEYPFPGGGCPTVGVAGLVLGGGWGYSSRLLGLAADNILEVEMVNYKGEIIAASENFNEDLFWACRGSGGGNFGVITSITFKLPEKIKMTTLIDIDYIEDKTEEIIKIFETCTNIFKDLDRRINLKIGIYNSKEKGRGVKITGLFYGSKEEASGILAPLKSVFKNGIFDLHYITLVEANRIIQDSHPPYEKYKSSGRFVYNDFSKSYIEDIINLVSIRAEGAIYTAVSLYGLGGAVMDKDKNATAFYYRDAKFIMGVQSVWEESKYAPQNIEWVKDKFEYIKLITTGAYINFPSAELEDYEKEYYGENLYKLKEVKRKYDPYNVFKFPQGIKIKTVKICYEARPLSI